MKVAIYSRFSTDRQSDGSAGTIAQQVQIATECAERHGGTVTVQFSDEGISGAAMGNRPGIQATLRAAEAGEFGMLIVADLSRLSRSQADLPRIIERLTYRGVRVLGAQDGFDSNREDSDLSAGLHGIIGQQFRRMIASRTRTALKMRAEAGRHAGGRAYGYRSKGEADGGRRLVIDAEEAAIVLEIFTRYANGTSSRLLAADLNARKIPSPGATWARSIRRKDGRWLGSGVYAILKNELYRGEYIWNRTRWTKDPDSGSRRRVERPPSEWVVRSVPQLQIVSRELWELVQSRIQARLQPSDGGRLLRPRRGAQPRHLLSGLLECAICGCKFIVSGSGSPRYVCSSHRNGGKDACSNGNSAQKARAESLFLERIKVDMLSPEGVQHFADQYRAACRDEEKARKLARSVGKNPKLTRLSAQVEELERMMREGRLTPAVGGAALSQARAEQEAALARLDGAPHHGAAKIALSFPKAADALRVQISKLQAALSDPEHVAQARKEVHRFFGGRVPVRPNPDGKGLLAEITWNPEPLLLAAAGRTGARVWNGSGGRI